MMRAAREKRTSFAYSDASEVFSVGATGCMTFEIVRASVAFRDNDRASRRQIFRAFTPVFDGLCRHALRVDVARAVRSDLCDLSHARVCRLDVSGRGLSSGRKRACKASEPRFSDHETKLKPSLTLHKELVAP
jgi:hypothetical protein